MGQIYELENKTDQNNTRKNGKSFEIAGIKSNWENNGSSFLAFNTNRVKHVFFLQLNLSQNKSHVPLCAKLNFKLKIFVHMNPKDNSTKFK